MFRAKIGPVRFFKGILGALSIAFSTTSIATAIPVTREEVTSNLNVSETTADLLVPLGASLLFALLVLEDLNVMQAEFIQTAVATTVLASIVLHGVTAAPISRAFGRWATKNAP